MYRKNVIRWLGIFATGLVALQAARILKFLVISLFPLIKPFLSHAGVVGLCGPVLSTNSAGLCAIGITMLGTFFVSPFTLAGTAIRGAYIPTLCGTLAWNYTHWLVHIAIPAVCMTLFVGHPQGAHAWGYTLYWLIPMIIYCAKPIQTPFFRALSSTFIMHAVGSVIWLYTLPLPSTYFIGLIPVVWLERLIAAMIGTATYHAWTSFCRLFKQITTKNHPAGLPLGKTV